MNAREEALNTLIDIENNGKMSHIAVGDTLMRHQFASKQDRAFYTRLCQGVMERRIYLDYILDHYSRKPMKSCKPLIRNLLRLGAYQILFMDVRDAAACNESVRLARKRHFHNLAGFVNGLLRRIVREKDHLPLPDKSDPDYYDSVVYSMPEWIVRLLRDQYGSETTEMMLASFPEESPLTVRINHSRIGREELEEMFVREGIHAVPGCFSRDAYRLSGVNYLQKYESFRRGYYSVQDESSMLPVMVSGLKAGDTVLDICSAPGGKALQAADNLKGTGLVIARDLSDYKGDLIEENVRRTGCSNVRIETWDALNYDPSLEEKADLVLADLPCSGLGVMGRKNDIKYRLRPEQLGELQELQRRILSLAWRYVKPGGELIYSTCTLNRGENDDNRTWILENTPLKAAGFEDKLPEILRGRGGEEGYIQVIPGKDPADGFYVSRFVKPE